MNKNNLKKYASKYIMILVLVAMMIIIGILNPKFWNPDNLVNILRQTSIYGILSLGMTFIIISKGIDLSVGSIMALSGLVIASLNQTAAAKSPIFPSLVGLNPLIGILAGLLVGTFFGFLNGFFVAKTKIPAFIATLGSMTAVRGLALMFTGGKPIDSLHPVILGFGSDLGFIPVPILVYIIAIVLSWILLNQTRFGSNAYAIGGNIEAARVSGVNIDREIMKIFSLGGFMCGVAALVFAGRVTSVHPGAGTGYELIAIAGTTIGGTSQTGGVGTIWGAVAGSLVLVVLQNGMTLLRINPYLQQVVQGAIIIIAVIIDMRKNRGKR